MKSSDLLVLLDKTVYCTTCHQLRVDLGVSVIRLSALFSQSEARVDGLHRTLEIYDLFVLDANCALQISYL